MGVIPIIVALFAGALIGGTLEARRSMRIAETRKRRRFNAIVEGTEGSDGTQFYHGVYYEVPDNDDPLPGNDPT